MSTFQSEKAALQRAAEILGSQAALAAACGFADRRHVWPWFNTPRRVPAEHCPAIERATGGRVRCEDLRPDVAWDVLRAQGAPSPFPIAEPASAAKESADGCGDPVAELGAAA